MSVDPSLPLVTVLTPVYNGARYLSECIESVLAQEYPHWEYVIVDNCSTDATLEIARAYAARDPRVRVNTNAEFVSMPQNFNRAFGLVSPRSRYFKVVCADDWIEPQCLGRMVSLAEANPSVGIVACHQQSGSLVRWAELPQSTTVLSGRDACRKVLLQGAHILPAPTAALYRTSLLASDRPFFPNDLPHSDTSACLEHLQRSDFGVVPEVLAVERVHEEQITSRISCLAAGDVAYLDVVLTYGPRFLDADEFARRKAEVLSDYYRNLGRAALRLRGPKFWAFHRARLADLGTKLERRRVIAGALQVAWARMRRARTVLERTQGGIRPQSPA